MEHTVIDQESEMVCMLHMHIRHGPLSSARSLVKNLTPQERRNLTKSHLDNTAALFAAIETGGLAMVKFLVEDCYADIGDRFCSKHNTFWKNHTPINPNMCCGSPIAYAINKNKPTIVRYLAQQGANVNAVVYSRKTVAQRACELKLPGILQILVEHGVDLEKTDTDGMTCLMDAAMTDIRCCRIVVGKRVNLNARDSKGNTALHHAAIANNAECAKLLLKKRADPFLKNNWGDDPLNTAAIHGSHVVMSILNENGFADIGRHIESYQLVGTYYFDRVKDNVAALAAWKKAIALECENEILPTAFSCHTPFGLAVEATSLSEIEGLSQDNDKMFMQSFVRTRKILGENHFKVFDSVEEYAARCLEDGSLGPCFRLLRFGFELVCNSDLEIADRFLRMKNIFRLARMTFITPSSNVQRGTILYSEVYEFLEFVVNESAKCIQRRQTVSPSPVVLVFSLIGSLCRLKRESPQKHKCFKKLVRAAVKMDFRTKHGETLLMLAVTDPFGYTFGRSNYWYRDFIDVLLECGADPDARNTRGDTALHSICSGSITRFDADILKESAMKFLEYGVHPDVKNQRGKETAACLAELGVNIPVHISLKCLAARAVLKHGIPYEGTIPKCLTEFVKLHVR